jgi:TPR repeat protein
MKENVGTSGGERGPRRRASFYGKRREFFRRLAFAPLVALFFALIIAAPARAEKRVALIIGNSAYRNVARLENADNDARLMAATLRDLGFVLVGDGAQLDLDKTQFENAVQKFGATAQGADVSLFYYAGHGVQLHGKNFLAPVEASLTKEADVYVRMLDAAAVLTQMEGSGARLNVVILDACRNNPFGAGMRGAGGGLAQMDAPQGTLISYATQPGNVAQDGADGDSPYTKALVQTIRRPGLGLFDVFNEVGLSVKRVTGGAQQPWLSSSPIEGGFYFAGRTPGAPASTAFDGGKYETLDGDRQDGSLEKVAALSAVAVGAVLSAAVNDPPDASSDAKASTSSAVRNQNATAADATPPLDPKSAAAACDRYAYLRLAPISAAGGATADFDRADAVRAAATCRVAVAAEPSNARLMFGLGRALFRSGGAEAEAVSLFSKAADAGNPAAMNSLGWSYAHGVGVARDLSEAASWYRKGAEAGNPSAMNRLAYAYEKGAGIEADAKTAMIWWRKAAEAGDTPAMNRLGLAYANGYNVAKDPAQALVWFRKAAAAGETHAMNNIGLAYTNGAGVDKDVTEAAHWFRKAALAGNAAGMNHLGYVYEYGLGVPKNPAEAARWYQKGADGGNLYAMNNLGLAYRNGVGVEKNEEEAERWLLKARQ